MYVNINLLPPEIRLQRERGQQQQKILAAGSLAGICLLVVFALLFLATLQVKSEAAAVANKRDAMLKEFPNLEQYAALQDRIVKGGAIINQAVGTPPDWTTVLYDLGQYMPANVWLINFTAAYQQEAPKQASQNQVKDAVKTTQESKPAAKSTVLTIEGYAEDQQALAELMKNLQQVKGLGGASCETLSQENLNGETVIRFKVLAELLPGPSLQNKDGTVVGGKQ